MSGNARRTGAKYERLAGKYLEGMGYRILDYNFRCRCGEIDIIAEEGEYLVFCEVKYRADDASGSPLEAVTFEKRRRISRTAMYYIAKNHCENMPCRFDVVGIQGDRIAVIRQAFDYTE